MPPNQKANTSLSGENEAGSNKHPKNKDELAAAKATADEYLNGWKRALADYENFKKESDNKAQAFATYVRSETIHDMLPILDNFKQALVHTPDTIKATAWHTGLSHIVKQWEDLLAKYGISKIKTLNANFDPHLHEAIETRQDETQKDQRILEVVSDGYLLNKKILRPAKVIVNKK